ncbi:MAG: DUF983 domain-containing protein [Bacteroidota bacterium]
MAVINKGTKAYSILKMKCPRCHEGDLFETGSFSFKKPFDMPQNCPTCGQQYFLGPGFYYGAMFISYIITGWYALIFCGSLIILFDVPWQTAFGLMVASMVILFVWFFRLARAVWINFNVKYDPGWSGKK